MRSCNRLAPVLVAALALAARAPAEDTTAPKVTDVSPLPGATLAAPPTQIVVTFDEAIDPATVSTSSFRLVRSGGDGTFVDGNEVEIALASVSLTTATVATMDLAGARLPNDVYQVGVSGSLGAGNALRFDGSDDFVYVPDAPELNPTVAITVEAWFMFEVGGSGNPRIVAKGAEAFGSTSYEILTVGTGSTRQIRGLIREASGVSSSYFNAGEWHHVAMTYGASVFRIYVNGDLEPISVGPSRAR